jgi:hypothetical protein
MAMTLRSANIKFRDERKRCDAFLFWRDTKPKPEYLSIVSIAAKKLIAEFETLPVEEQQAVVKEFLRRLPSYDSGPLNDDEVAMAGDQIAAMLDKEESDSPTR